MTSAVVIACFIETKQGKQYLYEIHSRKVAWIQVEWDPERRCFSTNQRFSASMFVFHRVIKGITRT